jgi:hypothetical protein
VTPSVSFIDSSKEVIFNKIIDNNGHDYVDLGLPSGTLWATMNIGASSATDPGSYFAWGETSTKSTYTENNYVFGTESNITKYNASDGKTRLELSDDAAHVLSGGGWHIPTSDQLRELCDYLELNSSSIVIDETAGTLTCGELIFVAGGVMINDSVQKQGDTNSNIVLLSSDLSDNSSYGAKILILSGGVVDIPGPTRIWGINIRPVLGGENYVYQSSTSSSEPETR